MKGLRGVLLTVLLLTSAVIQAQTWELQFGVPRRDDADLHVTDMTAVGSQVWAVGRGIWHSADSGQTWSVQMDTWDRLWYVNFRDAEHGWAVGERGWIVRTDDGGQTWSGLTIGDDVTLEAIAFVNEDRGWVVGWVARGSNDSAFVAETTDGGATWNPMSVPRADKFFGIAFADENRGYIYGNAPSLKTTDGGETWEEGGIPRYCYVAAFPSADRGYAAGYADMIYLTTDGGESWEGTPRSGRFFDVWFPNETHGWLVGRDGLIVSTTDGGVSWESSLCGTQLSLRGVVFLDPTHGLVGGEYGVMRVTEDGGQTWSNLFGNEEGWPDLQAAAFDELGFNGWVVGQGGAILHTSDGGQSWAAQASNVRFFLHDVALAGSDSLWAVCEGGLMTRTTDGGETWNASVICDSYLDGVCFVDALHGWVVGGVGTILRTTDGGLTWEPQVSGTEYYLNDVSFASRQVGCAVGDRGTALYTTDGGETWNPAVTATGVVLHGVLLLPDGQGWAGGDNGRLLYTPDGGASWGPIINSYSASWRDFAYLGDDELVAVGDGGAIIRSTDLGYTWTLDVSSISDDLYGCATGQDGRYAWAVGENGVVLHAGGEVTSAPNRDRNMPQDYALAVYPNPFNPRATITFDLPVTTRVSLVIYDVTGRIAARLTDGMLSSGAHSMTFDGSALSSGIYFARLEAGSASQTRKLVLLK